jgi:hypothetical protein
MSIADTVIFSALSFKDRSFSSNSKIYGATLFPFDSPAQQISLGRSKITCALTVCAALREGSVDGRGTQYGDLLREPFDKHDGQSMPFLEALGRHHGLWLPGSSSLDLPDECCAVVIGSGLATHTMLITGRQMDLAPTSTGPIEVLDVWETIEGGQPDPGNGNNGNNCTAIRARVRRLERRGRGLWVLDNAAALGAGGRAVYGWLRAGDLPSL